MTNNTIQIIKTIDNNDKAVLEAIKITEQFKVLPYCEVEKRLDIKASNFSLSKAKA